MIPILEFQERSLRGPVMKTTSFDIGLSKKVRELVEKHGIRFDPEVLVADDETADAVFQAGVDLLAEVGLYHLDTHRVIRFEREEILQLARELRASPPVAAFGRGEDRITIRCRSGEEARPPLLAAGAAGAIDPEWFHPFVRSFVEEPSNRALGIAGGITAVDGQVPRTGTLTEMACAQWECEQLVEILRQAGRPGMHLGLLCTASTAGATMACMKPGLREPHNTQIGIHVIPEQKIDWTRLVLARFCRDRGITPWTSSVSLMEGLCRNGAEAAVGMIANLLAQLAYGQGSLGNLFTNRMNGTWGDAEAQWAFSAACRASVRNLRIPVAGVCAGNMTVGGTEIALYQSAAMAVSSTASGMAYAWIAGGTGLEARLLGEVLRAVAGMDRERASDLARAILAHAEEQMRAGPVERAEFPACYDIETGRPRPRHQAACENVREGLARLGVPLG